MRLYKARPQTVEVEGPFVRHNEDHYYLVHHANGEREAVLKSDFEARYEPVIDLRV